MNSGHWLCMWAYKPATKYRAEAFSIWIAHCEFLLSGAFNWITPIWKGFSPRTFMFSFHHQHLAWHRKRQEKNVSAKERLKYQGVTLHHLRSWAGPLKSFSPHPEFIRVCFWERWRCRKIDDPSVMALSSRRTSYYLFAHIFPALTSCLVVIKPCLNKLAFNESIKCRNLIRRICNFIDWTETEISAKLKFCLVVHAAMWHNVDIACLFIDFNWLLGLPVLPHTLKFTAL